MTTPNDLPIPTILHSRYRAAKRRIRQLEQQNKELKAAGRTLVRLEGEARAKADVYDYLMNDIANRLPNTIREANNSKEQTN